MGVPKGGSRLLTPWGSLRGEGPMGVLKRGGGGGSLRGDLDTLTPMGEGALWGSLRGVPTPHTPNAPHPPSPRDPPHRPSRVPAREGRTPRMAAGTEDAAPVAALPPPIQSRARRAGPAKNRRSPPTPLLPRSLLHPPP